MSYFLAVGGGVAHSPSHSPSHPSSLTSPSIKLEKDSEICQNPLSPLANRYPEYLGSTAAESFIRSMLDLKFSGLEVWEWGLVTVDGMDGME